MPFEQKLNSLFSNYDPQDLLSKSVNQTHQLFEFQQLLGHIESRIIKIWIVSIQICPKGTGYI